MFEFMYRYRMIVLVLIVVSMAGFGVWGLIEQALQPSQPDSQVATLQVPGTAEPVELRASDIAQTLRYATMLLNDGFQFQSGLKLDTRNAEPFAIGFEGLRRVARASGVVVEPNEVNMIGQQLAAFEAMREFRALTRTPPVEERHLEFATDLAAALVVDRWLYGPLGPKAEAVFAEYQKSFPEVTAQYVHWVRKPASEYTLDLTKDEDKATLKKWFDENTWVASQPGVQIPEQVDVGVVVVRYLDKSLEELRTKIDEPLAKAFGQVTVTAEEIDRRIDAHLKAVNGEVARSVWGWYAALEAAQRAASGVTGDQPDERAVIRPQVERELKVAKVLGQLWDAAQTSDLKTAAPAFGLEVQDVDELTAEALQGTHPTLAAGPNLWQMIRGEAIAKLGTVEAPGAYKLGTTIPYVTTTDDGTLFVEKPIFDSPGRLQAIYTLRAHRAARTPAFEEILDKVMEQWRERTSMTEFSQRGTDFTTKSSDWVKANVEAVKTKRAELETEAERKIVEEIAQRELSREKEGDLKLIEEIEKRHRASIDNDLRPLIEENLAQAFPVVAAEMGLEIRTLGPITAAGGLNPSYNEGLAQSERLNRYLNSQTVLTTLANLEEGKVTPFGRTDFRANIGAHFLVTEKRLPTVAEMLARPDRWQPISQRVQNQSRPNALTFEDLKSPKWFSVSAPTIERNLAEQAARAAAPAPQAGDSNERLRRRHGIRPPGTPGIPETPVPGNGSVDAPPQDTLPPR